VPLYAFSCKACGPFEARRPASGVAEPVACPACGEPGRRVFTPPCVPLVAKPMRKARHLEEKSGHEPNVVGEPSGRRLPRQEHAPMPPWIVGH
jgi:putative FmdB family regulatory protein